MRTARLEYEYSLAAELDLAWTVKPLARTPHEGSTILAFKDSGASSWIGFLSRTRGNRIDLNRFLRIAIGLVAALGQVQRRVLIPGKPHYTKVVLRPALVIIGGTR